MKVLLFCAAVLLVLAGCGDTDPSHYQTTANSSGGQDVPAGPIWNNDDAHGKCPNVCGARGWNGAWHTVVSGSMSVCSCGGYPAGGQIVMSPGRPTSCSASSNKACSGCSVSCPPGKQASCSEGGISGSPDFAPICDPKASCECK